MLRRSGYRRVSVSKAAPIIIFHTAYALDRELNAGSAISPKTMLSMLRAFDYDVREVTGSQEQRKQKIRALRKEIRQGLQVEFVYSEASSSPTGLGERLSWKTSFTLDLRFLSFCKRQGIPVGLFYGDIFWRFPFYDKLVKTPRRQLLKLLHLWDVWRYRIYGFRIYLPTLEMARWMPFVRQEQIKERLPGAPIHNAKLNISRLASATVVDPLNFFYVGGIGSHYSLIEFVAALQSIPEASLTICTPAAGWEKVRSEYEPYLTERIRVVSGTADELAPLYANADVCVLAVEATEYWQFAAPFKLWEYISYGKPIIATADSWPGRYVKTHGYGWTSDNDRGSWRKLVRHLLGHTDEIGSVSKVVERDRSELTWEVRAQEIIDDLTNSQKRDS